MGDGPTPPTVVRAGTRLRTVPFLQGDAEVYRAKRYRVGPQRLLHRRELRIVRQALHAMGAPAISVLDVPCGYGRILELLAAACATTGADLSWVQAKSASRAAPALAGNLLAGLPFPDGAFDAAVCVRLFHHLADRADRATALAELARVARRHVLLSYYAPALLWRWHRAALERLALRKPRITTVLPTEILADARAAGLAPVREWTVLPGLHAHRFVLLSRA